MNADIFYTSTSQKPLPLLFVHHSDPLDSLGLSDLELNQLKAQQFKADVGEVAMLSDKNGYKVKMIIGCAEEGFAKAIASAVLRLTPGEYICEQTLPAKALLNWSLAQYAFDQYKKAKSEPRILDISNQAVAEVLPEARAVFMVRDLINRPANDLNPDGFTKVLKDLAFLHGADFKQWVGQELIQENFPAIYAVGRAAESEPRLLSLEFGDPKHPRVAIVGKGVCFDSGGLDIKPASGMRLMKKDMGGAAQVVGLAQWLMEMRLPIRLQVLIPAVENAVGSFAYRPGDILKMRNGLTVEIENTDAEGRLVLADAITKACEDKPELILDFATLTGAARIAVGTELSAMFTTDDELAQSLIEEGLQADDPIWRLPLFQNYNSMLDSSVADLSNCTDSGYAGAITAALFLQRFLAKDIAWAHFDIMAWNLRNKPGKPEGGEAMAMRAVGHYLMKRYS